MNNCVTPDAKIDSIDKEYVINGRDGNFVSTRHLNSDKIITSHWSESVEEYACDKWLTRKIFCNL